MKAMGTEQERPQKIERALPVLQSKKEAFLSVRLRGLVLMMQRAC